METATEVCSVALSVDGRVVALEEDTDLSNHAARLTLLIQQCVRSAGLPLRELDAVAVSRGPGSYTSLRVGASTAKGLCYALGKPLIAVDTLQALAEQTFLARNLPAVPTGAALLAMPMLDARRKEVWTAVYNQDLQAMVPAQPLVLEHDLFEIFLQSIPDSTTNNVYIAAGNGVKKLGSERIFEKVVAGPVQRCSAAYLAASAQRLFEIIDFQDVAYFEPFYMKDPNITVSSKPRF